MAPQNGFDHCAQTLRRRKLKLDINICSIKKHYFWFPTILDKIRWDTLPYGREKAAFPPFPLFNVAVMLSRTLTYMLTYNIDLGDGGREKVALLN